MLPKRRPFFPPRIAQERLAPTPGPMAHRGGLEEADMRVEVTTLRSLVEQLDAVNGDVVAICQVIDQLYEALAVTHNALVQATLEEVVAPGWEGAVAGP